MYIYLLKKCILDFIDMINKNVFLNIPFLQNPISAENRFMNDPEKSNFSLSSAIKEYVQVCKLRIPPFFV